MKILPLGLAFLMSSVTFATGQNQSAEDLKAVVQSGKVSNNVYSNSHMGLNLKLPQNPPCDVKLNTGVTAEPPQATLLSCVHYVQGMVGMYTFGIVVEYWTNYPNLEAMDQLVFRARRFRHHLESDPTMHTVQTEQARRIAGRDFVEIFMSTDLRSGGKFNQAAIFTQFNRYLLVFVAATPTVDAARALLKLDGKLDLSERH